MSDSIQTLHEAPPSGMITEPIEAAEFGNLVATIQSSMFRLEALSQYLWAGEADRFQAYLEGEMDPPSTAANTSWCDGIKEHRARGRIVSRVHVLPPVLTPYLRYEIDWGYSSTVRAGEDVRFKILPDYDHWRTKFVVPDFWIFDDRTVVVMKYELDGTYLHGERLVSQEHLPYFLGIKDAAILGAISLSDVLGMIRRGELG